jgi:hypothetical protein
MSDGGSEIDIEFRVEIPELNPQANVDGRKP